MLTNDEKSHPVEPASNVCQHPQHQGKLSDTNTQGLSQKRTHIHIGTGSTIKTRLFTRVSDTSEVSILTHLICGWLINDHWWLYFTFTAEHLKTDQHYCKAKGNSSMTPFLSYTINGSAFLHNNVHMYRQTRFNSRTW